MGSSARAAPATRPGRDRVDAAARSCRWIRRAAPAVAPTRLDHFDFAVEPTELDRAVDQIDMTVVASLVNRKAGAEHLDGPARYTHTCRMLGVLDMLDREHHHTFAHGHAVGDRQELRGCPDLELHGRLCESNATARGEAQELVGPRPLTSLGDQRQAR